MLQQQAHPQPHPEHDCTLPGTFPANSVGFASWSLSKCAVRVPRALGYRDWATNSLWETSNAVVVQPSTFRFARSRCLQMKAQRLLPRAGLLPWRPYIRHCLANSLHRSVQSLASCIYTRPLWMQQQFSKIHVARMGNVQQSVQCARGASSHVLAWYDASSHISRAITAHRMANKPGGAWRQRPPERGHVVEGQGTPTRRETNVEEMGAARAGVWSDRAHTRDYPSACQRPPAVRPADATGLHGNRINACDATVGTRYVPFHESFTRTLNLRHMQKDWDSMFS